MMAARPKLTEEVRAKLVELVASGAHAADAARELGFHASAVYWHAKRNAAFAEALADAHLRGAAVREARAAATKPPKPKPPALVLVPPPAAEPAPPPPSPVNAAEAKAARRRASHAANERARRAARPPKPPAEPKAPAAPRDTRPPVRARVVEDALAAAAAAAMELVDDHARLDLPAAWGEFRRLVCPLPDAQRRAVVLALVEDEGRRIRHDRGADVSAPVDLHRDARASRARGDA